MSKSPHRVLRIILRVVAFLTAIGALLLIFGGRQVVMRLFLNPPETEITTVLLLALKEMGGIIGMVSVMLFLAARDPDRNVIIIDALITGLCILAVTPLVSLLTLDTRPLYPGYLLWGRSIARLVIVGVLLYLRPRPVSTGA